MGCCASTPHSSTPTPAPASSSVTNPPRLSSSHSHPNTRPPSAESSLYLLRPHRWTSKSRRYTPSSLAAQRAEFWDTRVTNRPEIWNALKAACEEMLQVPLTQTDTDEERIRLATAQEIFNAAGVRLQTGDLADGAWDELGNYYKIPKYCVADPDNVQPEMAEINEAEAEDDGDKIALSAEDDDDDEEVAMLKDKGKATEVVDKPKVDMVKIRYRFGDPRLGVDGTVKVARDAKVALLINEVEKITKRSMRIYYLGKAMDGTQPLLDVWREGDIVQPWPVPAKDTE